MWTVTSLEKALFSQKRLELGPFECRVTSAVRHAFLWQWTRFGALECTWGMSRHAGIVVWHSIGCGASRLLTWLSLCLPLPPPPPPPIRGTADAETEVPLLRGLSQIRPLPHWTSRLQKRVIQSFARSLDLFNAQLSPRSGEVPSGTEIP